MISKKVTIIIPFISLNPYVNECIESCTALCATDYSILLLPDSSLSLTACFDNKGVHIIPTGSVTISAKRNIGFRYMPDSEYYALIDSDAYPHPDWLKNGISAFSRNSDIWAVGGPNLAPLREPFIEKVVGNAQKSLLVSGYTAFSKIISENRFCPNLHSCNLILKGEAIRILGGFNEKMETGEDRELCKRIIRAGKKIFFDNTVIVYHHNRPLGRQFFLQRLVYGYYIFRLMREKGNLFDLLLFIPLACALLVIVGIILSFFSIPVMIATSTVLGVYILVVTIEACRWVGHIAEIPLTLGAIILSNAACVLGSMAALSNIRIDVKTIYNNYEPQRY